MYNCICLVFKVSPDFIMFWQHKWIIWLHNDKLYTENIIFFFFSVYNLHFSFRSTTYIFPFGLQSTFFFSVYNIHSSFWSTIHIFRFGLQTTFFFSIYNLHFYFSVYNPHSSFRSTTYIFIFRSTIYIFLFRSTIHNFYFSVNNPHFSFRSTTYIFIFRSTIHILLFGLQTTFFKSRLINRECLFLEGGNWGAVGAVSE